MSNTTEDLGEFPSDGSLSATMLKSIDKLNESMERLNREMTDMRSDLSRDLRSLKDGQERQESRLSAIERFPHVAISQPPRLYGTQAQSVSSPKRVRTGYAG